MSNRPSAIPEEPACHNSCSFFGRFGIIVQLSLAVVCFSALLYKRSIETPRRPLQVFKYDVVKNAIGGLLAHFMNLGLSEAFSYANKLPDPCPWYLVNIFFDCTLGIFINLIILRGLEDLFRRNGIDVQTGDYGNPPQIARFLSQFFLWVFVCIIGKMIIVVIFVLASRELGQAGVWLLTPLCPWPKLELVVVMVIVPLILNTLYFWAIDNVLKHKPQLSYGRLSINEEDDPNAISFARRGEWEPSPSINAQEGADL